MNASLMAVLTSSERLMVAETEPAQLAPLDEDAAVELHTRIRRARDKYVGQYRRGATARVATKGGRGKAGPENERATMKAEAFEEALSRVSRRVAVLARQSAADLRRERVEAARAARQSQRPPGRKATPAPKPGPSRATAAGTGKAAGDRALRSPAARKRQASIRATGARKQAKRDSR